MSPKLICCEIDQRSKIREKAHLLINQDELLKIQEANRNINDLKLFYETLYMLKENYSLLLQYISEKEKDLECSPIDINNERYLEINRHIFNIVSSFNVINEHIHYLLKKYESNAPCAKKKHNKNKQKNNDNMTEGEKKYGQYMADYISPHYDNHFEYRFLYQMRNHVNHQRLAITVGEFNFNGGKYSDKFYVTKESLLENHIIKQEVREEINDRFNDKIDIFEIIKMGVPDFINTVLRYIQAKFDSIKEDINLIKEYKRRLRRQIKAKINEKCLIYGVQDASSTKLTCCLPVNFIQCYENNEAYIDIL